MFNFTKKLLLGVVITSTCGILLSSDGRIGADIEEARRMLVGFQVTESFNITFADGKMKVLIPVNDIERAAILVIKKHSNDILTDFRLSGYDGLADKPLDAMTEVLKQRDELQDEVTRLINK